LHIDENGYAVKLTIPAHTESKCDCANGPVEPPPTGPQCDGQLSDKGDLSDEYTYTIPADGFSFERKSEVSTVCEIEEVVIATKQECDIITQNGKPTKKCWDVPVKRSIPVSRRK
jgi:hypothetical protein